MERKLRVLVVEDDEVLRRAFSRALLGWSTEVIEAATLAEGKQALTSHPDLVILDIGLPDGSGVLLAEQLATMSPQPMCIAISGQASASEAFKLKELGVLGYIAKPLSLEDLTSALDKILQTPADLEPQLKAHVGKESFRDVQRAVRRSMVKQALGMANGNLTHAAGLLNITRQAVQYLIRDFDLSGYVDEIDPNQISEKKQGEDEDE